MVNVFAKKNVRCEMTVLSSLKSVVAILVFLSVLIVGCSGQDANSESNDTSNEQTNFSNIATASGKVVPVQWADLSFENSGQLTFLVAEGSEVQAGEQLAQLDATNLELAVTEARAALASAEAQLAQASVGSRTEDIAAAEGAVMIARGNVASAEAALEQAKTNAKLAVDTAEATLAQAQGSLEAAQAELARAQAELGRIQADARPEEIAIFQARLAQAEALYLQPRTTYDDLLRKDARGVPEELARFTMDAARANRDAAAAELALAQAGPAAGDVAAGRAAVAGALAQVAIAEAGVQAAEVALTQAEAAESDIDIAEAQLQIARGQLAQAEAEKEKIQSGATAEEIAVLESRVTQSEAALAQAESALAKATLVAPFDGTVGSVYQKEGEIVIGGFGGTPVLALGNLGDLRVETTDLNEVDAAQVGVGSFVSLTFDALPGIVTEGEVVRLAPMAADGQGGTNFTAIIELDSPPEALRWGMTAFVDIELD
jgi:multidrug efflux pump subunit AcrA (membrane-fusion protein)